MNRGVELKALLIAFTLVLAAGTAQAGYNPKTIRLEVKPHERPDSAYAISAKVAKGEMVDFRVTFGGGTGPYDQIELVVPNKSPNGSSVYNQPAVQPETFFGHDSSADRIGTVTVTATFKQAGGTSTGSAPSATCQLTVKELAIRIIRIYPTENDIVQKDLIEDTDYYVRAELVGGSSYDLGTVTWESRRADGNPVSESDWGWMATRYWYYGDWPLTVPHTDRVPEGQQSYTTYMKASVDTGSDLYLTDVDTIEPIVVHRQEEYVIAFYADTEGIGHGFMKVRSYSQPGQWTGYGFYPNGELMGALGLMMDDTNHVWDRKLCFRINHTQYLAVMAKVELWRTMNYYLTGQNCVTFVYDVDEAIGNNLLDTGNVPLFLFNRLGNFTQAIDNTNSDRRAEIQETEEQIIDSRPAAP